MRNIFDEQLFQLNKEIVEMITDMERIGDHATNIAEWVIYSVTGMHK